MNHELETTASSKNHRKLLYALAVGFACFVGASTSLVELQSSVGVKHSIGTTSVLIGYVVSALSSVLIMPFLLKRYGPKSALLAGDILWPAFTLANFYPEWPTMVSGSILFGIAQPLAMGTTGVIAASLGRTKLGKERASTENQTDIGILWVFVCIGQFTTNALVGIILKSTENIGQSNKSVPITFYLPNISAEHLSQCGSQDCPIEYAHENEDHHIISNLLPNKISMHIVLLLYLSIHIVGILVHWAGVPANLTEDASRKRESIPMESNNAASKVRNESASTRLIQKDKSSYFMDLQMTFQCIKRHLTSVQGLLILPVTFYYGLFESFIWSEFSRAFVSCTIGVEQVGFTIAILDLVSLVTSLVIAAGSKTFGIVSIVCACFIMELFNYLFLLFWNPTPTFIFVPFVMAATLGLSHGLRRNATYLVSATNFDDVDIAYSLQIATESFGIAIGYTWSTPFCVYLKLYIMISSLILSTVSWAIGHIRLHKYNNVPF